VILPLLGFDIDPGRQGACPGGVVGCGGRRAGGGGTGGEDVEAAQRWVGRREDDDNTCQPCRRATTAAVPNRAAAYADYPGGEGYVRCVGAEYGNECRCKVIKRGRKGDE
jgi:hypothetical protein